MSETEVRLSLSDLAFAVERDFSGISADGRAVIATILRQDPRFAEQLAELEAMARDAGLDSLVDGLGAHQRFEILLSEQWQHPSEVLDEDPEDVWYEPLLHLVTTLADRAEDPEKLLAIERRLEAAYAISKLGDETFRHLAERLDKLDPDVAERTLRRLADHLRRRREARDGQ